MNSIFSESVQQEMMNQIIEQVSRTLSTMTADKQSKRYLRYSEEAPEYCSVSQGTFREWVVKYKIPVSCIGGVKLVDKSDLDKFICSKKV